MSLITASQVLEAQSGGIAGAAAAAEIVTALEGRIKAQAFERATFAGRLNHAMAEDLAQEGRLGLWQALATCNSNSDDECEQYLMHGAGIAMGAARQAETGHGLSRSTANRWERAVRIARETNQDAFAVAQDAAQMGKGEALSAETAMAARQAYQGSVSLDAPYANALSDSPDFRGDSGAWQAGWQLPGGPTWQSFLGIPEDLVESSDIAAAKRKLTCERVHATLGQLRSKEQRTVLCALTGVDPVSEYGPDQDDDLAADTGIPRSQIKVLRSRGKARFAELWYQAYGQ